jgi:N-acetyl-anhydromuramyl-L-alanine amidase AmpD
MNAQLPLRIVMHWTAGNAGNQIDDKDHYHEIVDRSGQRHLGKFTVDHNCNVAHIRAGLYAAHTSRLNTGSIGLSMDAMRGAQERPFSTGPEPITTVQLQAFVKMVAEYARKYHITITPTTVLTHAEVQPTLGVQQRGKWDICWLPGMSAPGDPVVVGNVLRIMVRKVSL